jgi:hypothetical protein
MEFNGTVYVMVRQFNGDYYMVPKQHASKFNKRTSLVLLSTNASPETKSVIASQIIKINRSIPKSVVAFPVEQFNRMVCKHQIPALKLAAY